MFNSWYKRTPKEFLFTLKANKQITHEGKLNDAKNRRLTSYFYSLADLLSEKLGCILFQIPPSIKKDLKILRGFLENLDSSRNNVVEFRHKSWYDDEVYEVLREYNTGYCIVSAPGLPTHVRTTSDIAYIRWHGKINWYRYRYGLDELKDWAVTIKGIESKKVYGYFNNDFDCNAVKNCKELLEMLK
jgi:uncharacterized protein YecE (DUF72 family)